MWYCTPVNSEWSRKRIPSQLTFFLLSIAFGMPFKARPSLKDWSQKKTMAAGTFVKAHTCARIRDGYLLRSFVGSFKQKWNFFRLKSSQTSSWSEKSCQYLLLLLSTLIIYSTAASDCSLIVEPTWWTALSVEQWALNFWVNTYLQQ